MPAASHRLDSQPPCDFLAHLRHRHELSAEDALGLLSDWIGAYQPKLGSAMRSTGTASEGER